PTVPASLRLASVGPSRRPKRFACPSILPAPGDDPLPPSPGPDAPSPAVSDGPWQRAPLIRDAGRRGADGCLRALLRRHLDRGGAERRAELLPLAGDVQR